MYLFLGSLHGRVAATLEMGESRSFTSCRGQTRKPLKFIIVPRLGMYGNSMPGSHGRVEKLFYK